MLRYLLSCLLLINMSALAQTHPVTVFTTVEDDATGPNNQCLLYGIIDPDVYGATAPAMDNGTLTNQTVRIPIPVTVVGTSYRFLVSNLQGASPLYIGAASIAIQSKVGGVASTPVPATFDGVASITIPVGAYVWSDFTTTSSMQLGQHLSISLYLSGTQGTLTFHCGTGQGDTSYISALNSGDQTTALSETAFPYAWHSYPLVMAVDALLPLNCSAVALFGDSISDGFWDDQNNDDSWPYDTARLLAEAGRCVAVDVLAQAGAPLLTNYQWRQSIIGRVEPELDRMSGVNTVMVLAGANDVQFTTATNQDIINGIKIMASEAHVRQLHFVASTLLPPGTTATVARLTAVQYAQRVIALNGDIYQLGHCGLMLRSACADAIADMYATVQDGQNPGYMTPSCINYLNHIGDGVHPNRTCQLFMAEEATRALQRATAVSDRVILVPIREKIKQEEAARPPPV